MFTFEAAAVVVAGAELTGFVCVYDDYDGFGGVEGDRFVVEGVAVDFEGGIFETEGGCELIHDAAADAYPGAVFGCLGEEGDFFWGEAGVGGVVEEGCGADFEGGGGAEAGSEGDVTLDEDVMGGDGVAFLLELIEDGEEVAVPSGVGVLGKGCVGGKLEAVVAVDGPEPPLGCGGGAGGDFDFVIDGGGKDEAAVVVGMFADEVDAAGGASYDGGLVVIASGKFVLDGGGADHWLACLL